MTKPLFTDGPEVTLPMMLEARECRAHIQRELMNDRGTLISYTLNMPGSVKRYPLADRAFGVGRAAILDELGRLGWPVLAERHTDAPTGLEAVWLVDAPHEKIKAAMVAIEEGHPLGRLFDMDVLGPGGEKMDRTELGLPPRGCLICGEPGPGCARSRAHPVEELMRATRRIMADYFDGAWADCVAQNALRALLSEVSVTPKPGLVDRAGSGAHRDMDFFTFIDSAAALAPYFRDMALLGSAHRDTPPTEALGYLRHRGIRADGDMFAATGGVNTHKGLIFSLGLVAAACGRLGDTPGARDAGALLDTVRAMAAPAVTGDLGAVTGQSAVTPGERLYAAHKITGVRGEAAAGFPAVREIGLPVLAQWMDAGCSLNDAGVITLLHLIAGVEDTNLIHRSDRETQRRVARETGAWLAAGPYTAADYLAKAQEMDAHFVAENLSPGGCADLLAITFMLYFIGQI